MNKHKVHVNGIDMVYEEYGHSNERAIVLLHGFCGSSLYWHKVCPQLSKHYRVILPNLRGHGGTEVPDGVYTMETMADDILGLIDLLGLDKTVIFGHSMGGYVALAFADKYSHRLSGFGLIHSTALPDTPVVKAKRLQDIEDIKRDGIHEYVEKMTERLFVESTREEIPDEVHRIKSVGKVMQPEGAIHALEGMRIRKDRSAVLYEANFPVLLVAGSEDHVISPDEAFGVNEGHVPRSTFNYPHISENTFEGIAHMSLVEVPEQLARLMANYLRTLHERETLRIL
ncbi:alpha/beta fold hydrolase [Paenibacillus albus]|nr:alpha/beta hydrolase [Paenibacillus albus]